MLGIILAERVKISGEVLKYLGKYIIIELKQ